jgi:hypothetical protein
MVGIFFNTHREVFRMSTDKKFAVAGVSTHEGKTKVRFANDTMRVKILAKNGHQDVQLVDLPHEMTKAEIAQHMIATGFGKGNAAIEAAVAYVVKKNPVATAAKVTTTTVAKTAAVAE